jgi:hypothetical protein
MEYQIVGINRMKGIYKTIDVVFDTILEAITYRDLLASTGRYDEVHIRTILKQEQ